MKGGFCYGSGKLHHSDFSYIQHTAVKQIMPLQFKVSGHQAFSVSVVPGLDTQLL